MRCSHTGQPVEGIPQRPHRHQSRVIGAVGLMSALLDATKLCSVEYWRMELIRNNHNLKSSARAQSCPAPPTPSFSSPGLPTPPLPVYFSPNDRYPLYPYRFPTDLLILSCPVKSTDIPVLGSTQRAVNPLSLDLVHILFSQSWESDKHIPHFLFSVLQTSVESC